jgi:hypothetical protein
MMFDDIAHNEGNPFPGKLFNTADGEDVYAACKLDYTGKQVTMANFFNVHHGNRTANGGRALGSTKDDNVFISYTDHGAPGFVTCHISLWPCDARHRAQHRTISKANIASCCSLWVLVAVAVCLLVDY